MYLLRTPLAKTISKQQRNSCFPELPLACPYGGVCHISGADLLRYRRGEHCAEYVMSKKSNVRGIFMPISSWSYLFLEGNHSSRHQTFLTPCWLCHVMIAYDMITHVRYYTRLVCWYFQCIKSKVEGKLVAILFVTVRNITTISIFFKTRTDQNLLYILYCMLPKEPGICTIMLPPG